MTDKFRITYATLSADNEDLQRNYDEAVERARGELGKEWPFVVNGEERWSDEKYEEPSPIDKDLIIGRFSQASPKDADDAVKAAKAFALEWERMGWKERVRILRNVADVMEDRLFDLAALMGFEVGKGWKLLTGIPGDIQNLRRRLGFLGSNRETDLEKDFHTGTVRYGNEPLVIWGWVPGVAEPESIAQCLLFAQASKPGEVRVAPNFTRSPSRPAPAQSDSEHKHH